MGKQWLTLFFWAPKSLQMVIADITLKDACSLEGKLWPNYTAYLFFIFFSFIFISLRLITLQYYSRFCHTLTWISHGFGWGIHVHSIFKSRYITLSTKIHLVKAMVFPVVMYGCESWTIKKAECWRIDAFFFSGKSYFAFIYLFFHLFLLVGG